MFGHDSKPSKIYSYGAKPPVEGLERVLEQMALMHRYRNRLVEIERDRRGGVEALLRQVAPDLGPLDADVARWGAEIDAERERIWRDNQRQRRRTATPADRARIKALREQCRAARKALKARRREVFASDAWKAAQQAIEVEDGRLRKQAQADSGLYWGNYLSVQQAMADIRRGAPPHFQRRPDRERVVVQIQKGLAVEELFLGRDRRVRLEPLPSPGRLSDHWMLLRLRVGSDGRDPVWAGVPVSLARDLPAGWRVKWVYLHRERVGPHWDWRVSFVVEEPDGVKVKPYPLEGSERKIEVCPNQWPRPDAAQGGAVGIDVGWRQFPDRLRVAIWRGSDGVGGELFVRPWKLHRWEKARDLQAIRDDNFNLARKRLAEWLAERQDVPDWLREATATMASWRSQARLAAVVLRWRAERCQGDAQIFDALEHWWRRQDKHLWTWQLSIQQDAVLWRQDLYRQFALSLARRYRTACVEALRAKPLMSLPKPEDEGDRNRRWWARIAAPATLLSTVRAAFTETRRIDPKDSTRTCPACGSVETWDQAAQLQHRCESCGREWDQDHAAAWNLLRWGGFGCEWVDKPARVPEVPDGSWVPKKGGAASDVADGEKRGPLAESGIMSCAPSN